VTEVPIPLSAKQRYLWQEIAGNPGIACRQILSHYAIDGPLDLDRLHAALCTVVGHHEQLRLRVAGPVDAPVATLRDLPARLPLSTVDLSAIDETTADELIKLYCEREAATYLDLGRDWAVRALVLHPSKTRHLLLLTIHHLVVDGWGAGLVGRHLEHAYREGDLAGVPASKPYTDYIEADMAARSAEQRTADLRWWVSSLRTVQPAPSLGTATGPGRTLDAIELHEPMPERFRTDLRRIARPARASTYVTLVALLAAALWHRTGIERRVLMVSHLGPRLPDYEYTAGLFSNRLPLAVQVKPHQTLADVVRTVHNAMLDLLEHASTPYFELLANVHDPRILAAQLTVQHVPPGLAGPFSPEAAFRFQRYQLVASPLPMHLLLMEEPDGRMWWGCEFRTDIFLIAEAMSLTKGLLADVMALAEREQEPIAKVLG
jgi:hypothetical protein